MHDFIIVGAGTAGCVLAEKLTASGRHSVLLVEAGGKPGNAFVSIPAGFSRLFKSDVDWDYESAPQTAADGRTIYLPRGKMLGGSSNMNAQIHQWCHPRDFAEWTELGAAGWGWEEMAPIFRQQEDWVSGAGDQSRGSLGPMVISANRHANPLARDFIEASDAVIGKASHGDYNGVAYEGAFPCQIAHKAGRRFSAYDAYLKPAMNRQNLSVLTGAHVTGLIVENGKAAGIRLRKGTQDEEMRCARGVVLASGAFNTPQILLLSGLGPADHLCETGITPSVDSSGVGANLQDHFTIAVVNSTTRTDTLKSAGSVFALLRYLLFKSGILASNGVEAFSFTRLGGGPEGQVDTELALTPVEWRNQALEPPQVHAYCIGCILLTPRSRGTVRLAGADPLAKPLIDFRAFTDPEGWDEQVMIEAMRLARRITRAEPLASVTVSELQPGEDARSDDELKSWLHAHMQTLYHPVGTCRMGSDPDAVVSPRLKFNGLDGLWIADASVMPKVPRGHPNAVVAAIAQRGAGFILEDAERSS